MTRDPSEPSTAPDASPYSSGSDAVSAALTEVFDRYAQLLRDVGARHRLSGSDQAELLQEIRIRLWTALSEGEQIRSVGASYLYRTAVTAALTIIRRRRTALARATEGGEEVLQQVPAKSLDVHERVEVSDVLDVVARAIGELPEARQAAVRLYLAGYGREEIATLVGWSEPKTRNLIYRGLAELRERLAELGVTPAQLP